MNDQNAYIYEEIRRLQKSKRVYQIMVGVGFVGFFIGIISTMIPLCLLCFPLIMIASFLLTGIQRKMKANFGASLVRNALSKVFDRVEYMPFHRLPDHVMELSEMKLPFDVDRIEGSDYTRAVYHGLELEFSDVKLIDRRSNGKHTSNVTVFEGLWLVCDFRKPISSGILLRERNGGSIRFFEKLGHGGNVIETENVEFNKKFLIVCEDQHDAFYVLTPHMMEYINRMDEWGMGVSYMRFTRSGKVHIAIHSGLDFFELDSKTDPAMLTEKFLDEVGYITGLIDTLHLSDLQNNS